MFDDDPLLINTSPVPTTREEFVEALRRGFEQMVKEAEENPLGVPQEPTDKRMYDLETMRELQRINPYCWIGDSRNPYQIPIAGWIDMLEKMEKK